jgi:hypothetical protein
MGAWEWVAASMSQGTPCRSESCKRVRVCIIHGQRAMKCFASIAHAIVSRGAVCSGMHDA